MAFGGGEIDEAAVAEEIKFAAVLDGEFVDEGTRALCERGDFFERGDVDFDVEVAGVAHDRTVLHMFEMFGGEDGFVAGDGDEDVADFGGFGHGHDAEAVHDGFDGAGGINFGDDDVCAEALGAHGDAAAAPAVAGDDDSQPGEKKVCGANDAVESGLSGAVAIIEEVLGEGVVDGDDWIFQRAVLGHSAEANDAGGGFFGAADDVADESVRLVRS